MSAKVDQTSIFEPSSVQPVVSTSTAGVAVGSPKVSKFGAKSGFVIPKNKLSGSLVPRGGGKTEAGVDAVKENSTKLLQRKTKWGTDLMQDPTVRKGRALAYQTRIEQIIKELKTRSLESGDDLDSSPKKASDRDTVKHLNNNEFDSLDLEKREIIGEILRLNPNFKTPSDYKPLLKEAKVPIPFKEFPGYNFIGLLLGPQSNTQKRLEEETGAIIHVYGLKASTGEKHEITQSEMNEAQGSFEELYVSVSADTYEKIDAAVALIELLLTPISGGLAVASTNATSSGVSSVPVDGSSQTSLSSNYIMPMAVLGQGVAQPVSAPVQSGPSQFQPYPGPWFQGVPPNAPPYASTGFLVPLPNASVSFTPFVGRPPPASQVPRTPSPMVPGAQMGTQVMQLPPNQAVLHDQPILGQQRPPPYPILQPNSIAAFFPASQPMPSGMMPSPQASLPMNPQSRPFTPLLPPPNRVLTRSTPLGSSSGWSATTSQAVPPTQRPNNLTEIAPVLPTPGKPPLPASPSVVSLPSQVSNLRPNVGARPSLANSALPSSYPAIPSIAPQSGPISAPAMVSSSSGPVFGPPMPASGAGPVRMPSLEQGPMAFPTATPPPPVPLQASALLNTPPSTQTRPPPQTSASVMQRPSTPNTAFSTGQQPPQLPIPSLQPSRVRHGSASGTMPAYSTLRPSSSNTPITSHLISPQPRPSSGDFTFQPLRGPVSASSNLPMPNSQHVAQNTSFVPPATPQPLSFRPASQNPAPSVGIQGFTRSPAVNQVGPSQAPILPQPALLAPLSFGATMTPTPQRLPNFINPQISSSISPAAQMGAPRFSPASQAAIVLPARPATSLQPHQNQLHHANRPSNPPIPNQLGNNQLGNITGKLPPTHGGGQVYDPFSPTSVSVAPPLPVNDLMSKRKPETDTEYEDLMASVGVR